MGRSAESLERLNEKYLVVFYDDLKDKFKEKTIRQHMSNAKLLLNDFLAYRMLETMEEGIYEMSEFFYFFIHKCMWSTPASVKSTGASIKKFYKCMYDHGFVDKKDYQYFVQMMKESLESWIEDCEDYNSGNAYYFF